MRAAIGIALVAALTAVSPADAVDRTFSKTNANVLTEDYVGRPLWSLLAGCAGAYGAAHAYYTEGSKAAEAEASKADGVRYLNLALARLTADRSLERAAALQLVAPVVEDGRAKGVSALSLPGRHSGLPWLALKTSCREIAAAA